MEINGIGGEPSLGGDLMREAINSNR